MGSRTSQPRERLPGRLRRLSRAALVSSLGFVLANAASIVLANPARPAAPSAPLPLARRTSLLVVAPHPDDEALACAGLIRETLRRGGRVRVVLVTNGDAFRLAAERALHKVRLKPEDYLRFGRQRREEARAAAAALGLAPDDVIALGFPDKGLAWLWLSREHQVFPYRSRATGARAVPYDDVWRPGAPYTAEALTDILADVMEHYRPDVIVAPGRADLHPDHWATGLFVDAALGEARRNGSPWARRVRVYRYVIHREEWHRRQAVNMLAMRLGVIPSGPLTGPWLRLDLTEEDLKAKRRAIAAHRSQVAVMPRFMNGFARTSELFQAEPEGAAEQRQAAELQRAAGQRRAAALAAGWRAAAHPAAREVAASAAHPQAAAEADRHGG